MRTQVMPDPVVSTPWLERGLGNEQVEKNLLETLPFRIGRHDTADLCIDSTRVSREHAVITRHGKKYHIHDLGSTNGTFLNGQRIDEGVLGDGDQVTFAEVEFTFFTGAPSVKRELATQVIPHGPRGGHDSFWRSVLVVRRLHEAVTRRGLPVLYRPIVTLDTGERFGFEALFASGTDEHQEPRCERFTGGLECRAADRLRRVCRRRAAEEAAHLSGDKLFVALSAAECDTDRPVDHVLVLRDLVGAAHQLVVEIPEGEALDSPAFRALRASLRDAEIQVAYDNYASSKAQAAQAVDLAPDYLKLAPTLLRSIRRRGDRQRQVERMIRASQSAGISVIACGVDSESELEVCQSLRCDLVQGDLLGAPQPAADLAPPSRSKNNETNPA